MCGCNLGYQGDGYNCTGLFDRFAVGFSTESIILVYGKHCYIVSRFLNSTVIYSYNFLMLVLRERNCSDFPKMSKFPRRSQGYKFQDRI